eukprot:2262258-Heterocapsa_arctica.AAC.2
MALPWLPIITVSDASDTGMGVCQRVIDPSQVARVGRLSEKWRFRVEVAQRAREHALSGAGHLPFFSELPPECITANKFMEVSPAILKSEDWQVIQSRRWQVKENILRNEGRALLWGLRRLMRSRGNHQHRILTLVDNIPLCLSLVKGRASSRHLLPSCRTSCALTLA